jgi:hypothetical protein
LDDFWDGIFFASNKASNMVLTSSKSSKYFLSAGFSKLSEIIFSYDRANFLMTVVLPTWRAPLKISGFLTGLIFHSYK